MGEWRYSSTIPDLSISWSEWSASYTSWFTPRKRAPGTHWTGGWVDPRAGLDDVEKRKFLTLSGLKLRPLGGPAHSQSLYRLCYPDSILEDINQLVLPKYWNIYLLSYLASIPEERNLFSYNYFMLTILSSHNNICL
jgi:hypothetical protein